MAGKITNAGERALLDAALLSVGPLTLHLAKLSFDVADDMEVADFTEATFGGYAPIVLTYDGLEDDSPGGRAVGDYVAIVFTCIDNVDPNWIYGYWVENVDGDVVIVERFAGAPRPMEVATRTISIVIQIRLWSPT